MTIDWWTLGIQTVNVVVLVWLLQRFFWRPVAAMIEQRRAAAQQAVGRCGGDARRRRPRPWPRSSRPAPASRRRREAILAAAHAAAEQARAAVLGDARKAGRRPARQPRKADDRRRRGWRPRRRWADRSSQLAVEIAGRLAARLDGPAVQAAFLDWLVAAIAAMPDPAAAGRDGGRRSAGSAQRDAARSGRAGALPRTASARRSGRSPHITFKVDPALIAGLELHGPHFTVGNSWRADLGNILADLAHATRH